MSRNSRRGRSARTALDCSDPDILFSPSPARIDRKLGPLCREVERTLAFALADARDPRLRDLTVIAVIPAPDASRLEIAVTTGPEGCAPDELLTALTLARGSLRAELARALQRKRTPEIAFVVVPHGGDA